METKRLENVESTIKKDKQKALSSSNPEENKLMSVSSIVEKMPKPWEDYYVQAAAKVPGFVMDLYYNIFK